MHVNGCSAAWAMSIVLFDLQAAAALWRARLVFRPQVHPPRWPRHRWLRPEC